MQVNSEGIVLKQTKAVGGKKIITLFTKKYGKISVGTTIGPKIRNKGSLAVRPFTLGNYQLFKSRGYYNLDSAEVVQSYFAIGEDVNKYMYSSYILELLDKLLPEEVPMTKVFTLTRQFFEAMEKRTRGHETLILAFEVKLLRALGLYPVLDRCVACGRLDSLDTFSVRDGGMVCSFCKGKIEDRLIYPDNFGIINIINYFDKKPFKDFEKIALDKEKATRLQGILRDYLAYHFDVKDLKSEMVFNNME